MESSTVDRCPPVPHSAPIFPSLVCCPVNLNTRLITGLNLQDSSIVRPLVHLGRCVDEDHRDQNVVNTVVPEDVVVGATQLDEGDSFLVVSNDAARVVLLGADHPPRSLDEIDLAFQCACWANVVKTVLAFIWEP